MPASRKSAARTAIELPDRAPLAPVVAADSAPAPVAREQAAGGGRLLVQDRSRARQERILEVATRLLVEAGSEHLRMSEIAKQAGISIGSLYQYFPDKAALMHTLARRHFDASRVCIETALDGAQSVAELRHAFAQLLDEYYRVCAAEPVVREVWSGLQADPALREIERQASVDCAKLLEQALARVRPGGPALSTVAFLVWQLGEATVRLALDSPPDEAERLLAAYRHMVDASLFNGGDGETLRP